MLVALNLNRQGKVCTPYSSAVVTSQLLAMLAISTSSMVSVVQLLHGMLIWVKALRFAWPIMADRGLVASQQFGLGPIIAGGGTTQRAAGVDMLGGIKLTFWRGLQAVGPVVYG